MAKKIRTAVLGANGRLGRLVLDVIGENTHFEAVWAKDTQAIDFAEDLLLDSKIDLIIDFSAKEVALRLAKVFSQQKKKVARPAYLLCTTGFTPDEVKKIETAFEGKLTWAFVPNTSLGIFSMGQSAQLLSKVLPEVYTFAIVESHHAHKKDAPSGTAKFLRSKILRSDVEMHAIRGGTEPGTHEIWIQGPFEKLRLSHEAQDPKLFASGSLKIAAELVKKTARKKPYTLEEFFEGIS